MGLKSALCLMALLTIHGLVSGLPVFDDVSSENDHVDNSLEPNAGVEFAPRPRSWVTISTPPPKSVRRTSGERVELECGVQGSPAPSITWLRDQVPISQSDEYESNLIPSESGSGLATVRSRIVINNYQPAGRTLFTCVARAGPDTDFATTIVHTTHSTIPKLSSPSEYLLMNQEVLQSPSKPRITLFQQTVMDRMGSTIILPCRAQGHPRPEIFWLFNNNDVITNEDPRVKVMRSGELVLQGLRWTDMGLYSCVARNPLGKDMAETFVYPMGSEK